MADSSFSGSFNHECAKWLSDILAPLREHPSNLKDMFQFSSEIKDQSLEDSIMYSYDVISLFTNIPLKFTIELILNSIF